VLQTRIQTSSYSPPWEPEILTLLFIICPIRLTFAINTKIRKFAKQQWTDYESVYFDWSKPCHFWWRIPRGICHAPSGAMTSVVAGEKEEHQVSLFYSPPHALTTVVALIATRNPTTHRIFTIPFAFCTLLAFGMSVWIRIRQFRKCIHYYDFLWTVWTVDSLINSAQIKFI
jgi:hypothetical protein